MQENNWLTEPQQQQNNVSLTTNTPPEEPYDMIQALFDLPDFNWADYPLSPVNVNNVNDDDHPIEIIDLTSTEDDDEMIDIDKYVFDSGELWNPTVKKIKKNKKEVKNKKEKRKNKKKQI